MPDTRPGRQLPPPDSSVPRHARRPPSGGAARPRARACLIAAVVAVAALTWRDAAATMTPVPSSVSIFPTQTSGFVTVNMTFPPTTFGGTGTISFTTLAGPLPSWLTTLPSPVTFSFAAGATSATASFRFQASGAASPGTNVTALMSTGGVPAGVGTSSVNVQVLQPSYTASASPNPASIAWGGSRNVTVSTSVDPGYNTSILYSFAGFPAGINWSTSQMVYSPYLPATFTCSVAVGTAPGTYSGNLMASGLTNKTFPMTVIVLPPDITASFTQPSVTVCNGGPPVSDSISLQPANGYVGTPTLTFQAVPAGLTVTPASPAATAMPPGQIVPFTVSASGASPGAQLVTLRIVDVGGPAGINKTIQLTVNVAGPDFTPAVSPPSLSLVPGGGSQSFTASVTPNACLSATTVTVTPSGQPAGVTFTPPVATLTGPAYAAATLAAQANPGTAPGTYPITLTFQPSSGPPRTAPATLVVVAAPDFSLAVAPPSLSMVAGSSSAVAVSAAGINGFSGPISVTAPALAGVTFNPSTFVLTPGGSQTVAVQTTSVTPPGTQTAVFTGTATGVSGARTGSFLLTITPPPDFTLAASPPLLTLAAGTSGSVTVSAAGLNGFSDAITVVSPTLPGVTFNPATFTLNAGGSQTVGVQVALSTPSGGLSATFTGTAPTVATPRTATFTLQITAPPDFTLAFSPPSLSLTTGSSSAVTVSATGVNGFSGTITVTAPALAGVTFTPGTFTLQVTPPPGFTLALNSGSSQTVAIAVAATATPGTYAAQFSATAPGVSGTHTLPLMLTVNPAPPTILSVTPPTMAVGAANTVLRLTGENFRPGASVTSPDTGLQVLRTTVVSSTAVDVLVTLASGARSGPYRLDLANTDGTRTSQGVIVLVYPTSSLAAPLGVTTAAIVFPRPYTLIAPDAPLFPRGLLATTGLGTIIGSWRYDGVPFDRFAVPVSGGMPVEVKTNVPIPISYTGEHRLELAIEQPQALVTEPVSVIQSLESMSRLEILSPPEDIAFADPPPLFRWSLVPGASGYEIEIEREGQRSPMRVRLSESEWRPSAQDVEAIGPGVHRFRVKAVFTGETSGEPTPWRRFAIPPQHAELRMLPPTSDPRTGRTVVRWEGGLPGLVYRVEFFRPGSDAPFASALTMRQRYLVPAGVTQVGAELRVRAVALGPDGSPRGTAAPTELRLQSSLAAPGSEYVLASAAAQVTAIAPPDGAAVTEAQPRIEVQWSGAVKPEEVLLTVDATDVTAVAAVSDTAIVYGCLTPLAPGAHTVQISLAGAVTRATFTVNPPPPAEAAAAAAQAGATRRDWRAGAMGNGTETSDQGKVHGDAGRLQLTGQEDIGSGESQVKATADLGGRREFEQPYRTVSESKNWQFQLGAGQPQLKEEGRFGYSPPDFLDQSELLAAGLARGGGQAKISTSLGSISYYQTFSSQSAGATGAPSLAQDLKGIGFQAPWDPTRYLLRAVVLRNEGEVGSEQTGVRGEAAGVFGRFVLGTGATLLFEGAYGKVTPQSAQSPAKQGGYGFHLGAIGMLGGFMYAVNLRKTEAEFSNPMNTGLTYGAVPDRVGGDAMLSRQFGSANVSLQLRRLESGGGSALQPPKATEDGAMLNLSMPLRSNITMMAVGTWTANKGDADPAQYLPAVSRTQRGATLTLNEVPGRLMFSQALSWQEMRDDNMPTSDQTVKSLTLSANGMVNPAVMLSALAMGTRSEGAPQVGRTDQLMLSLQPMLMLTRAFLTVTPRAAYMEVKSSVGSSKTTTEQFQMLTQLTPPWFGSLLAFQVAADWSRSRTNTQSPAPGFTRRIVGTCTLRWGAQRKPDLTPGMPVMPPTGAGWNGPIPPTLPSVRL